jgi:hypothetical protein
MSIILEANTDYHFKLEGGSGKSNAAVISGGPFTDSAGRDNALPNEWGELTNYRLKYRVYIDNVIRSSEEGIEFPHIYFAGNYGAGQRFNLGANGGELTKIEVLVIAGVSARVQCSIYSGWDFELYKTETVIPLGVGQEFDVNSIGWLNVYDPSFRLMPDKRTSNFG